MAGTPVTAYTGMTKAVVLRTFVRIAQYFVGFCCFLKFFLGRFVSGVTVRVILHGNLAVRFFDLVRRSAFANP